MQHPRSTTPDIDSEKSDRFVTLFPEATYGQHIRTFGVERLSAKQEGSIQTGLPTRRASRSLCLERLSVEPFNGPH